MAANVVRIGELKQKDCDLKLEGKTLLGLPVMRANNCSTNMEEKDLSKRVTSSSGYESLCRSPRSITGIAPDAQELKLKYLRNPNSADYSQVGIGFRSKDSHGDSVSEDNDQMLLRVRRELREIHSGIRSPKPSSSNSSEQDPDKMSAYVRARNSKIISSNMLSIAKNHLKIQSLVKETVKGKGISNIPVMDQKVSCDTRMKSLNRNGQHSSLVLDRSGPESISTGICLREWLEPGRHKVDIAERLLIFRQIVELVDFAHYQGVALQELRPSRFILLPSNVIKYTGASAIRQSDSIVNRDLSKKRLLEQRACAGRNLGGKQRKLSEEMISVKYQPQYTSSCGSGTKVRNEKEFCIDPQDSGYGELQFQNALLLPKQHATIHLEETWYTSPEDLSEIGCTLSSNIYGLGILLFELLCCCESWEVHSAVMLDLHHRILPPNFLSRTPKEAGFCFWLLHPEPLSRPTTREILQSELIGGHQEVHRCDDFSNFDDDLDAESELRSFLLSLKDRKHGHASKLIEDIRCLEEDISKFTTKHLSRESSDYFRARNELSSEREQGFCLVEPVRSGVSSRLFSASDMDETQMMKSISRLDNAYFSARSQMLVMETASAAGSNKDMLNKLDNHVRNVTQDLSINKKSDDPLGAFFDGLTKFACHKKFKECGTLRNADLLNSSSAICSLSFDRDEDYIATAGVSKKIKIFDFGALVDNSLDIHYPSVEMSNNSKLSSVCWNNYFKSYLASSDYDGVVQIWDANTGQGVCQHKEHERRAWSVDFSQADPTKFASGSDDFSVRLWDVKEENSINTIWNPANVCYVQFSAYSSHLLILGCADYKIYGYDLRHTRMPWCTLPGHEKAVSYVRFVDKETLVSASTDNTLKLWDLNKSSSTGLSSNACSLTFSGHTNEKVACFTL
ncbi:hypothetical protein ABKV19_023482 [Rosa sericea]